MGVVLKAKDSRDNTSVAIKLINSSGIWDQNARTALVREAEVTARLQHPNIVSIYDVGQHDGNLYIVMEYLRGRTLQWLIQNRWPLTTELRLQILIQLCEALAYAHERGIFHLDVKPLNMIVLSDGLVKVLDFGITARAQISSSMGCGGTPPYMSPEQVNGTKVDGCSDIWAAGVTLFQLFTGRLPFIADANGSIYHHIVNTPVPTLPKTVPLSRELTHLLQRAMHKAPEKRFHGAEVFATELRRLAPAAYGRKWVLMPSHGMPIERTTEVTMETLLFAPERRQVVDPASEVNASKVHRETGAEPASPKLYKTLNIGFDGEPVGAVTISGGRFSISDPLAPKSNGKPKKWIVRAMEKLYNRPRCPTCRRPMRRRSSWKSFAKYNVEVVRNQNDCIAALRSGFWPDAAKLLCIHGVERPSLHAKNVIATPLRNNLDFFECGACACHLARLFTDELIEERWLTRPQYLEARRGPEKQKAGIFDFLVGILYAIFRRFLNGLRNLTEEVVGPTIDSFTHILMPISAALCIIVLLVFSFGRTTRKLITDTNPADLPRMSDLADRAYNGSLGYEHNLPLAARYYRMAAEKGDARSSNRLGVMLERGMGVPVDSQEALHWYRIAADAGNADAEYNVGRFYEEGIAVPTDMATARRWYEQAAKAGSSAARDELAVMPGTSSPHFGRAQPKVQPSSPGLHSAANANLEAKTSAKGSEPDSRH